jgi:hypothetical protein
MSLKTNNLSPLDMKHQWNKHFIGADVVENFKAVFAT